MLGVPPSRVVPCIGFWLHFVSNAAGPSVEYDPHGIAPIRGALPQRCWARPGQLYCGGGASPSTVTGESVAASPVKFQTVTSKFISAVASSGVGGANFLEVFLPSTSYATDVVLDSISVRGGPSECRLVTGAAPGSAM